MEFCLYCRCGILHEGLLCTVGVEFVGHSRGLLFTLQSNYGICRALWDCFVLYTIIMGFVGNYGILYAGLFYTVSMGFVGHCGIYMTLKAELSCTACARFV